MYLLGGAPERAVDNVVEAVSSAEVGLGTSAGTTSIVAGDHVHAVGVAVQGEEHEDGGGAGDGGEVVAAEVPAHSFPPFGGSAFAVVLQLRLP